MNVLQEKYKGAWAYLLFIVGPVIILYACKDNTKLTKIHAAQAMVIHISIVIASILTFIPFVGCIAMLYPILTTVLMVIGAIKSCQGEEFNIPLITDCAKKIFKNIIEKEVVSEAVKEETNQEGKEEVEQEVKEEEKQDITKETVNDIKKDETNEQ